jgi:VWA domain-containing protein
VHLTFLTPLGGLLALAALVPLGTQLLHERRAARVREALRLDAPGRRGRLGSAAALALVPVLLGAAAAQPVLESNRTIRVRTDAAVFYVLDTSDSMRASAGGKPTRLDRAVAAAGGMRSSIPDVPSGVATMTDRVLPNLFPTGSERDFIAALTETVGIDRPPPKGYSQTATTFAALDTFAGTNFFAPGIVHRLVVVLTDGETAPYFTGDLRGALRAPPRTRFVIVRFWHANERIVTGGRKDNAYQPDSASARNVATLATITGGRAFDENRVHAAITAARTFLGHGPLGAVTVGLHVVALARWLTGAALSALVLLLWRRHLV